MEEIHVGVIDTRGVSPVSLLANIFALRTHVPEDEQVDFKYIMDVRGDTLLIGTHDISLKFGDMDIIQEAIPSGSCVQLFNGNTVTVWHLEVE